MAELSFVVINEMDGSEYAENLEEADFETAIHFARHGKFQKILLGVCGVIYASCAISSTTLSFVLPSAQCDFHLTSADKGKLSAMPLIGMIFGCGLWGCIADTKGRRLALMSSLSIDFIAAVISSMAPNFPMFLFCRFFNGFGIIGATSLVFPYLGEFVSRKKRDATLGRLELFWNIGALIIPGLAWALLNKSVLLMFTYGQIFSPWRIFVLVSSLPSFSCVLLLYFMPETPKFLLSKRRFEDAKHVFRKVYATNTGQPPTTFPVLSLYGEAHNNNHWIKPEYNSIWCRIHENTQKLMNLLGTLCSQPNLKYLFIIAFADFGLMASYYTLIMWFPELFERYSAFERMYPGAKAGVCFVSQLPKQESAQYSFEDCDPSINNRVFIETIIIGIACIPSAVTLSFFMQKLGKKYILIGSLILSGISTMALNWVYNTTQTLILSGIFEALTSVLETVLFCVVVDIFPTNLRAPAVTITATFGRLGAILGNVTFGFLIDIKCEIPVYLLGSLLIGSGILCIAIPSRENYTALH